MPASSANTESWGKWKDGSTDASSILPDNTATPPTWNTPGVGASGFTPHGHNANNKLTPEQMDWLLKRLSSDDQVELAQMLKSCTFEMTMTRGLPFAALVTGSMYFARSRLPEPMRFGPKGWFFYSLIGVGSLTAANMLSMNTCGDRVRPRIWEMYNKYSSASQPTNATNYEALRAANRHGRQPTHGQPPPRPASDRYDLSETPAHEQQAQPLKGRPGSGLLYEDPPPMSGTPYSQPPPHQQPPKTSSYGDEGFS